MAALCLLAFMVGALAASALATVPFAIVVTFACVIGIVAACLVGLPLGGVLPAALGLLVAAQVGFGIGLGCRGLLGRRRVGDGQAPEVAKGHLASRLHSAKPGK